MNRKDLLIMAHLRKDARISLTNMSKATNIPVSTIYDRIKMHEKSVIRKHTTLLDFSRLGYNTRANIILKLEREHREAIKEHLINHPHVNSLYKINNGYDYMVECIFRNMKDLHEFIEILDQRFKIQTCKEYYVINDIKREAFMANPQFLDLIY